jgi:hypothetical protein
MQLLPARRGFEAWLALFALALQMAVSFGHVHLDGIRGNYPGATAARFAASAHPQPNQQPTDDDDAYCAICATIYLAGNSFVPQPPALPAQFASRAIEHPRRAPVVLIVAAHRNPFQSRAPPRA